VETHAGLIDRDDVLQFIRKPVTMSGIGCPKNRQAIDVNRINILSDFLSGAGMESFPSTPDEKT
jgi:hypothetical protein